MHPRTLTARRSAAADTNLAQRRPAPPVTATSLNQRHRAVYDDLAPQYEARIETLRLISDAAIGDLLRRAKPRGRALDIGCGAGAATRVLAAGGYETVSLDISPQMLAAARRVTPTTRTVCGDYLTTRELGRFDAIVAFAYIHLFPRDLAVANMRRMAADLTDEGLLLVSTTREPVGREGLEGKGDYDGAPKRFRRRWTEGDFTAAITESGLEAVDVAYHPDPFGKTWVVVIARRTPT